MLWVIVDSCGHFRRGTCRDAVMRPTVGSGFSESFCKQLADMEDSSILLLENSYHLDPPLQDFGNPKVCHDESDSRHLVSEFTFVFLNHEAFNHYTIYQKKLHTAATFFFLWSGPPTKSRSQEISCWKITLTETNIAHENPNVSL